MKVYIDVRLLDKKNNTGISRYIEFLLDFYISKYSDVDIALVTNDKFLKYRNCNIIYTKLKPYNILHFILFYFRFKRVDSEIFHSPFYSGFLFGTKKSKNIITVHDLMYRFVPNFFSPNNTINRIKIIYFDFIVSFSIKNADKVISVSNSTKQDLLKFLNIDSDVINEAPIKILRSNDEILKRNNLLGIKYFFYCGNNRKHKNLNFLINVFNKNTALPLLVLAGNGHKSCQNVLSVGRVTDEELRSLYENSLGFIFPSEYEGFGLPVLESLFLKTPVILSKIPAFLEFKKDKNTYFFSIKR